MDELWKHVWKDHLGDTFCAVCGIMVWDLEKVGCPGYRPDNPYWYLPPYDYATVDYFGYKPL